MKRSIDLSDTNENRGMRIRRGGTPGLASGLLRPSRVCSRYWGDDLRGFVVFALGPEEGEDRASRNRRSARTGRVDLLTRVLTGSDHAGDDRPRPVPRALGRAVTADRRRNSERVPSSSLHRIQR